MIETLRIDPFAFNVNSVDINFMERDDVNMIVNHPTEIDPFGEEEPRHEVWE